MITHQPWRHPDPQRSPMRLVEIPIDIVDTLARTAQDHDHDDDPPVSSYLRGEECRSLWRIRSAQLARTPADVVWVTRLVIVPGIESAVGVAGFHGAPDATGTVEVGYRIDPAHRRRGYARQALEIMLAVAAEHPDVRTIRATIGPANEPSLRLIRDYGFVEVGSQIDDEDGLELVFEAPATS